jgi:hypothetical protein
MTSRKAIALVNGFFEEVNAPTDKLDLSGNTTSDLTEGTNLYYTDTRVRDALSLTTVNPAPNTGLGSLTYDGSGGANPGRFTFTQVTNADVRGLFSVPTSPSTGIDYNSATGVFQLSSIPNSSLTNNSIDFEDARGVTTTVALGGSYEIKEAQQTIDLVRNETGSPIAQGTPVAIVGYSSGRPLVAPADADDAARMPCIGIVGEQIPDGNNGVVVATGVAKKVNTGGFSVGDTVYVGTTPGQLTTTPPTGETSFLQNIGIVTIVDATNGQILVLGPGRSSATPNLNNGNIFKGNASNQAVAVQLDTDEVPELGGATNLYFTEARARNSISVANSGTGYGSLGYVSGTGVITYTKVTSADIRGEVSAATATGISYNSGTGQFSLGNIPNSSLSNSSITVGTTAIALGGSSTTLAGLTSVTTTALTVNDQTGGLAIRDADDATRIARFDSGTISASTTRTYTFPDESGTLLTSASTIPGGTFVDSTFRISDDSDSTKKLAFECSGITTNNTRTLTVPDGNGTIATQDFATAIAIALG